MAAKLKKRAESTKTFDFILMFYRRQVRPNFVSKVLACTVS